jgi:hypothetical protein
MSGLWEMGFRWDGMKGFFGMEIGTYESAKNIVTGSGTLQDYAGIALAIAPTGKGARDVIPLSPNAQNMGIVPDGIAGKIDADTPQKAVDAEAGKKSNDAETGKKGDDIQVRSQAKTTKKTKGSDGKAYAKGKTLEHKIKASQDAWNRLKNKVDALASENSKKKTYGADGGAWCSGYSPKRIATKIGDFFWDKRCVPTRCNGTRRTLWA